MPPRSRLAPPDDPQDELDALLAGAGDDPEDIGPDDGQDGDPLDGYRPDWRRRVAAGGQAPRTDTLPDDDPLKGYTPNWRGDTAEIVRQGIAKARERLDAVVPPPRPFFQPQEEPPPVRQMGPTPPRGGMRPSRRAATPPPPAPVRADDPYTTGSDLSQRLARLRYQSILTPLLSAGRTGTEMLRAANRLGSKIPGPVGEAFGETADVLSDAIDRDKAREAIVRERYMGKGERLAHDLLQFGVEYEIGSRLAPILRSAPAPAKSIAGRIAQRAVVDAANFGGFEMGKTALTGGSVDDMVAATNSGMASGLIFGGAIQGGAEAVPRIARVLRPVVSDAVRDTRIGSRMAVEDMAAAASRFREKRLAARAETAPTAPPGDRVAKGFAGIRRTLAERLSPELAEEANRDALTGALNKRADTRATTDAIERRAPGSRVIRLRADIDNFKALNDTRGHEAGDEALRQVADAWRRTGREGDVLDVPSVARPGGDEFGATLVINEGADAEAIARRYEEAANTALRDAGLHDAGGKGVGVSVGWAEHAGGGAKELEAAADAAATARKKSRGVSKPRGAPAEPVAEPIPAPAEPVAEPAAEPVGAGAPREINPDSRYANEENPQALFEGGRRQVRGYSRRAETLEGHLASEINPTTGRKWTAQQRKTLEAALADARHMHQASLDELENAFGPDVRALVEQEFPLRERPAAAPTPPEVGTVKPTGAGDPDVRNLFRYLTRGPDARMTDAQAQAAYDALRAGGRAAEVNELARDPKFKYSLPNVPEENKAAFMGRLRRLSGEPAATAAPPEPSRLPVPEAGAPRDEAAVQEGLFGERTLQGNEQTSLLPESAGVPTARLRDEPIRPEEMGRVRREGAEPEGDRPGELFGAPGETKPAAGETKTPVDETIGAEPETIGAEAETTAGEPAPKKRPKKIGKMTDAELESRYGEVLDRMDRSREVADKGSKYWLRKPEVSEGTYKGGMDPGPVYSGRTVTGEAGRAYGRLKDDARIIDEIEAEMERRGMDTGAVLRRYLGRDMPVPLEEEADPAVMKELQDFFQSGGEEGGTAPFILRRADDAIERALAAGNEKLATQLARRREMLEQQAERAAARAAAAKVGPVTPETRPKGTATMRGRKVRQPTTLATPLDEGFEAPLLNRSETLPDAGKPQMTPAGTPGADVAASRARIVNRIADVLQRPVRVGKLGGHRTAGGIYKIRPEVIRLRFAKDIEVLAHEVGHHIHKLFFGTDAGGSLGNRVLAPWVKELKPLGKGISDESTMEGLAEFYRRYLTNPAAAKKAAPTFYQYVEQRLAKEFPELAQMFTEARADYQRYLQATPEARIASNISMRPTRHWSVLDWFRRFHKNVVDDLAVFDRVQQDILSSALGLEAPPPWRPFARARWLADIKRQTRFEEDAATLARLVRGSFGIGDAFIYRGSLDYGTLDVKGPSLEAILRPVRNDIDAFIHYGVSRRALELAQRGVESGFRPQDARAVIAQYNGRADFAKAFDDLQTYQQHLLEYLRDVGTLSPSTYRKILAKNENYLPFNRVLDEEMARRAGGTTFGHQFNPVKRIKGSAQDIVNPLESIIKNTYAYTNLAARHRVTKALVELSKRDGAGLWVERIPTPTEAVKVRLGDLKQQLVDVLGDDVVESLNEAELDEMLMVFRPGDYFGKDNIVSVLQGGRRVWYEVHPELYDAMMGLSHEQANTVARIVAAPAKLLRAGATLAPEFILRNPMRDQIGAFVQSEYGYKPVVDWTKGLFTLLAGEAKLGERTGIESLKAAEDMYWKWKAAGGEHAALLSLDRDALRNAVRDVLGHAKDKKAILGDVVKSPVELLRVLSAAAEDATRLGEFQRAIKREGMSRGGLDRAAAGAREVSVDFARHGAKTEAVRIITAFWNARLQGYHRLARAFRDNPLRTTYRATAAITMPSVLLYYANKDDEEYKALPQWERDLFWHVKVRGTFVRIPKPFELGIIFGTIPERILEWHHTRDPGHLERSLGTLAGDASNLLPMPTSAVPLIENFANWSLFRSQPIVSRRLEDVQPPYQFTSGTSEVSKGVGKMLNYSPEKIDNLMFGWTGGLGRLAVDVADRLGRATGIVPPEVRPERTLADVPGVRGFVSRKPGAGSDDVERFYNLWGEAQQAKATRDLLYREGRDDELDRFDSDSTNTDRLDRYDDLEGYAKELADLRRQLAEASHDPELSPAERRRAVEELGKEMQQLAAEAIGRAPARRE